MKVSNCFKIKKNLIRISIFAFFLIFFSLSSSANDKPNKLIIPKGFEVMYDANNKPYFIESQSPIQQILINNKAIVKKYSAKQKESVQTFQSLKLRNFKEKCYVWNLDANYEGKLTDWSDFSQSDNQDNATPEETLTIITSVLFWAWLLGTESGRKFMKMYLAFLIILFLLVILLFVL